MADFTTFKRSMGFSSPLVWTPTEGEPADLIGWTVTSTIMDGAGKRHKLTVTNPSGDGINYLARATVDSTKCWAPGKGCKWDVRYDPGNGFPALTQTWYFEIEPEVTLDS